MQHLFQVQGMTCGHCERAVVHAVRTIDSDAVVHIELASGKVTIESDRARPVLAQAIEEEGYKIVA